MALQMMLPSRPASKAKHQEANAESSSASPLQGIVESAPSETPCSVYTEAQNPQTSPSLFRDGNISEPDKSLAKIVKDESVSVGVEKLAENFDQNLGTDIVDIYVGSTQRPFRIHKKLLCDRIPFFSKMFNGPFQEARISTATLPEDNADAFALLVEWVYKGTFKVFNLSITTYEARKSEIESPKFLALFRLYGLAGKYLLHPLMDYVMSLQLCYWEKARCTPALSLIELIFKDSWAPPNSPCRRYLAKWLHYYYVCPNNGLEEYRREPYTVAELANTAAIDPEMAELFMEHLRGNDWALFDEENKFVQFDYCEFHMHPGEEDKQCLYTRVRIQQPTVKSLSAWWEQEI